jgi:hypothetical protein
MRIPTVLAYHAWLTLIFELMNSHLCSFPDDDDHHHYPPRWPPRLSRTPSSASITTLIMTRPRLLVVAMSVLPACEQRKRRSRWCRMHGLGLNTPLGLEHIALSSRVASVRIRRS